jgi:hypothetical protein
MIHKKMTRFWQVSARNQYGLCDLCRQLATLAQANDRRVFPGSGFTSARDEKHKQLVEFCERVRTILAKQLAEILGECRVRLFAHKR